MTRVIDLWQIEKKQFKDGPAANLAPKFCPIDGSPLEILEDVLVCTAESHNWELELGGSGAAEFYTLKLSGY